MVISAITVACRQPIRRPPKWRGIRTGQRRAVLLLAFELMLGHNAWGRLVPANRSTRDDISLPLSRPNPRRALQDSVDSRIAPHLFGRIHFLTNGVVAHRNLYAHLFSSKAKRRNLGARASPDTKYGTSFDLRSRFPRFSAQIRYLGQQANLTRESLCPSPQAVRGRRFPNIGRVRFRQQCSKLCRWHISPL